jgi:hypothetical protein
MPAGGNDCGSEPTGGAVHAVLYGPVVATADTLVGKMSAGHGGEFTKGWRGSDSNNLRHLPSGPVLLPRSALDDG